MPALAYGGINATFVTGVPRAYIVGLAEVLNEQSHTESALEGALENAKRTVFLLEELTGR